MKNNYHTKDVYTMMSKGLIILVLLMITISCSEEESGPLITGDEVTMEDDKNEQDEFKFDFGSPSSPVSDGYTRVSPQTITGTYRWVSGASLFSRDRAEYDGVDDYNRDFIFSTDPKELEIDIPNGSYDVVVTFGDSLYGHDDMEVTAEGILKYRGINTQIGQFSDKAFTAEVSDGGLSLKFDDAGGANTDWTITRITIAPKK